METSRHWVSWITFQSKIFEEEILNVFVECFTLINKNKTPNHDPISKRVPFNTHSAANRHENYQNGVNVTAIMLPSAIILFAWKWIKFLHTVNYYCSWFMYTIWRFAVLGIRPKSLVTCWLRVRMHSLQSVRRSSALLHRLLRHGKKAS